MDPEKLKHFTTVIGAVAEMTVLFYKSCKTSGSSEAEAVALTEAFIRAIMVGPGMSKNGGANE